MSIGCPQGGVLSTLLWNISFDDLLKLFDKDKEITIVGYADDGSIIITGNDLKRMYEAMNRALAKCQSWADTYGLDISPTKTEYMLCTQKKSGSYKIPTEGITIKGCKVDRVTTVKYLGVYIDHRLTWNEHINAKLDSARKMLYKLKNYIGKTWGPSPKLTKFAYTSSVRPIISYASFAFAHSLTKGQISKLKSFQRRALMMLGNFRKNTPSDALDVITDTVPLSLFIEGEAMKATFRISPHFEEQDWRSRTSKEGHIKAADKLANELDLPLGNRDDINEPNWDRNYQAFPDSEGTDIFKGLRCYTDGSKGPNGCGAGTCISIGSHILQTRSYGLSQHATVFQTEAKAITLACSNMSQLITQKPDLLDQGNKVVILSDSKSVIGALNRIDTTSKALNEAKNALNRLATEHDLAVEVRWIMAHKGITGNEIADRAAKTGANLPIKHQVGLSKAATKERVTTHIYKIWNEKWKELKTCRQTKMFLPEIDRSKSKEIRVC